MEKAVLKTLIYSDIFDYPLKAWEIHKWLVGEKLTLQQVDKLLGRLEKKKKIKKQSELYYLKNRNGLAVKRIFRQQQSEKLIQQAKIATLVLRLIPGIKLIGISGALAMNNAQADDDIDLFIVTGRNRLWLVRFIVLALFSLIGKKRQPHHSRPQAAGKFCLNTILEEDQLMQERMDLYTAHEVLQMKVLWQDGDTYSNYLMANEWVFKFLPNWRDAGTFQKRSIKKPASNKFLDSLNDLVGSWQLKYMKPILGQERVSRQSVYFHPVDYRQQILLNFKQRTR